MAVTAADLKTAYPEFSRLSDSEVEGVISRAGTQVSSDWGECQDEGIKLLSAHFLSRSAEAKASSGKGQGAITSIDIENQVKKSFAQPKQSSSGKQSEYSTTIYGQQFEQLKVSVITPMFIL